MVVTYGLPRIGQSTFFIQQTSDQICDQLCSDIKQAKFVDLQLSVVKPLGAQWITRLYDYFKSKPDIAKNGF